MDTKKVTLKGYHGTSNESARLIVDEKRYIMSNKSNDWLGKGIYFFCDKKKEMSVYHADKWAYNIKHFPNTAVLTTDITVDKNNIMNLTDEDIRDYFQAARDMYILKMKKENIIIKNSKELDCAIFNELCENDKEKCVFILQTYIRFDDEKGTPSSGIPNCTIMCVKKEICIDKESIEIL